VSYEESEPGLAVGAPEFEGRGAVTSDFYFPPEPPTTGGKTAAEVDQKIIKTGYLDLVVEDVSESVSKIRTLATGKGGFEQTSSVSEREDGTHYGDIVIRVPAAEFEGVMNELKTYATLVKTEEASGQDVTEEYSDLQAQLTNAEAQKAQYLEILEKAKTVEEILMVQPYIDQVTYTIASLTGRIQYLENVTALSTISVNLAEEPTLRVPTKEFRPLDSIKEAFQALVAVAQQLVEVLIWFVVLGGGILLPVALLVWLIVRIVTRFMKK
jgi:hypothetical protein